MDDFPNSVLAKYSLWIVVAGCIFTAFGAYFQYLKEVNQVKKEALDAKEALKAEQRRVAEHDSLQKRSNSILDRTGKVLEDTKGLLDITRNLLVKADSTIAGQTDIILTQNEIIGKQISTLRYLSGTESIPRLIIRSQPFLSSFTNYELFFILEVNDDVPLRDLEFKTFLSTDDEMNEMISVAKTDNDLKDHIVQLEKKTVKEGPMLIPGNKKTSVKTLILQFPAKKERTLIHFDMKWPKGSFSIQGALTMNNEFENSFKLLHLMINGKNMVTENSLYVKYDVGIGPINQKRLKMLRQMDSEQRRWREEFDKKNQKNNS